MVIPNPDHLRENKFYNVNYVINCKSCEYVTGICKLVSCQWGKPQQSILGREHSVPGIQNNRKYKLPHTFFYKTVNIKLKRQSHKHYGCTYFFGGWVAYEVPVFTVFLIIIF